MFKFGLIGNPVAQSKSPYIHQTFLKQIGKEGQYDLFEINENELIQTIEQMIKENYDGFNVTVPYKETVIKYLDELDESAKDLHAVNTVKIENNKLIGYNTDGNGYVESLKQAYPSFFNNTDKKILIIGAGGAAKGIYFTLQKYRFKQIDVTNRTIDNAKKMISGFENSHVLPLKKAENVIQRYDLIIQTTSVGMIPNEDEQIISLDKLSNEAIVSDIIYKPKWTRFLIDANNKGANLLFGESMLWYQAKLAFEIWTNTKVNVKIIE